MVLDNASFDKEKTEQIKNVSNVKRTHSAL